MLSTGLVVRKLTAVGAIMLLAGSLGACSALGAKGGDTTCGEYRQMSDPEKTEVIENFFKEKGESNPPNGMVLLSQKSADLYCATVGTDTDPIKNIDG